MALCCATGPHSSLGRRLGGTGSRRNAKAGIVVPGKIENGLCRDESVCSTGDHFSSAQNVSPFALNHPGQERECKLIEKKFLYSAQA